MGIPPIGEIDAQRAPVLKLGTGAKKIPSIGHPSIKERQFRGKADVLRDESSIADGEENGELLSAETVTT
ncbi:hypothetical protein [Dyella acidiphila]|uniref:Uncharacterized protein n=1 Tax=Dyella acidiphila TaxID=2775866 RepID=A0ABR9GB79_9GAMM|nr:hypothetical protein [Dyella acidiphila]MBE1161321.1 hypothetical protein [Dyella acidiphila]